MIVISLALILVAVALLVFGLASGSSVLLVISIGASLLAAVALVVGARQAAASRSAAPRVTADDPHIPAQHVPPATDTGTSEWRQPPGSPVATVLETEVDPVEAYDDEPAAQEVSPEQAAQVARLPDEVRVVDGRPRYHLDECSHLVGRDHEPLPVAEAVELGFTPCARCAPDAVLLSRSGRH